MPTLHVDLPVHLNYLAVLVCGLVNFAVGGLWYSPVLFADAWMKAAKHRPSRGAVQGIGMMYAGAVASAFVVALSVAYLLKLTHAEDAAGALRAVWTAWIGFTCATAVGDYAFLRRGLPLFVINMGVHLVTLTANALILNIWR